MAAIVFGVGFIFGAGAEVPLPAGWTKRESPQDWLTVIDPDGNEYLVKQNKAYPWRVWGPDGLRPGKNYVDLDSPVDLIKQQYCDEKHPKCCGLTPNLEYSVNRGDGFIDGLLCPKCGKRFESSPKIS